MISRPSAKPVRARVKENCGIELHWEIKRDRGCPIDVIPGRCQRVRPYGRPDDRPPRRTVMCTCTSENPAVTVNEISGSGSSDHPGMTKERNDADHPSFRRATNKRASGCRWRPPRRCIRRCPRPICGSGMSTTAFMRRRRRLFCSIHAPFEVPFKPGTPSLGKHRSGA